MLKKALVPEDIPRNFAEAWKQKDAQALASLFVEDADFINVTGIWWEHRKDIQKAHDFGFRIIFKSSQLNVLQTKVRYLTRGIATVHAKMEVIHQTNKKGELTLHKRNTLVVFVAKKSEKQWLCYSAQNSEILPGAQTFLRGEDGAYKAVRYDDSEVDDNRYED